MEYELIRSKRKTISIEVKNGGKIIVRAPLQSSEKVINAFIEKNSDWLKKAVEKSLRRQELASQYKIKEEDIPLYKEKAELYLPERTYYWSKITGLIPSYVRITSAGKRFGSCNGKNGICFSYRLMAYDEKVIDYVILHELCHIKHKDHSKAFYSLICQFMPDYKSRENILKHKGE